MHRFGGNCVCGGAAWVFEGTLEPLSLHRCFGGRRRTDVDEPQSLSRTLVCRAILGGRIQDSGFRMRRIALRLPDPGLGGGGG